MEKRINSSDSPEPNIIDRIQDLKDRLEVEAEKENLKRSNKAFAKMNLEGQKPTKYFCSLEKQMKKSTLLDSLFIENDEDKTEETFDQGVIEKEVKKCYKNLYAKTTTYADKKDIFRFIGKSKLKTLTPEEPKKLEREIDQNEVSQCLKGTRNNVAPGASGLLVHSTRFFGNC